MLLRNFGPAKTSDDQGLAFVAVLAVMALGLIVLAIVVASLANAFLFSSVDKSSMQSQVAADSGLAVAEASLNTLNACAAAGGIYTSAVTPNYRATVWRSIDTSNPTNWVKGCPNNSSKFVRIISSGHPESKPLNGISAGLNKYVEAVYQYLPGGGNSEGVAANYVYNIGTLDTYTLNAASGGNADVMVKTGDYACTGPTYVAGNVIVAAGSANLTNTCQITGSLLATGNIQMTVQSGVVGNAISTGGSVSISNSTAFVTGNVYANGLVTVNGTVGGNIETTGGVSLVGGSSVAGNIWSGGAVTIPVSLSGNVKAVGNVSISTGITLQGTVTTNGTVNYNHKTGNAAINAMKADGVISSTSQVTINAGSVATPVPQTAPSVPDWADVFFKYSDWQAQGFNNLIVWPSALGCNIGGTDSTNPSGALYPYYQQLKNLTVPTVVDIRGCSSFTGDFALNLKTNIAFFSEDFNFRTLNMTSSDGLQHKLWFIVPEVGTPTGSPICPKKGGNFAVTSAPSEIGPNVTATVYAPCNIATNNGLTWRGLFYSGGMVGGGGVRSLTFVPIGVPGTSVANGVINPSNNKLGALIIKRNRSNSGE